jgi:hypothetical protein
MRRAVNCVGQNFVPADDLPVLDGMFEDVKRVLSFDEPVRRAERIPDHVQPIALTELLGLDPQRVFELDRNPFAVTLGFDPPDLRRDYAPMLSGRSNRF